MAEDKKIAIEVEVKGTEESINSVKDLKNAIKAAKDEQVRAAAVFGESSKEFVDASKKVSALKDKVDDLADSTKSLKGSGVERASEGFNQLGEGLRNLDFDKVKVGLVAMKSALAAVGIGLIVQAVMYLVENFEELSKGSGVLAQVLRGVGDVINSITNAAYKLTDALGLTNSQLDKMGEATVENANAAKEALAGQTAEYDRQIAVAKASGKSAVDLEIAKQKAIIETNKALVEQTIAYVKQGGVLTEEQNKLLTGQLEAIKNASTQQQVITLNAEKEKNDKLLKQQEDYRAKKKIQDDILLAESDAFWAREQQNQLDNQALTDQARAKEEADQLALEERQRAQDEAMELGKAERNRIALENLSKQKEEAAKKDAENEAMWRNNSLSAAQSLTSSLQSLSDAYFHFKTKNLQKGSAEELKQAKKQFDINKGIAIANATISGIQGVVNALSAQSVIPEPFGAILKGVTAVAVGAAAVANISKIESQKFNPGGGGGGGGGVAAVAVPSPPTINTPSANTNSSTSFDETGKKVGGEKEPIKPTINVNSTVSVKEINDKQNDVKVLEEQSTFK
jgi:chromosome segregation ATPase